MSEPQKGINNLKQLCALVNYHVADLQESTSGAGQRKQLLQKTLKDQNIIRDIDKNLCDKKNTILPQIHELMGSLMKGSLKYRSQLCLQWIVSFMKIRPLNKAFQYSPPPNVVPDNAVIALPDEYGPMPKPQSKSDAEKVNQIIDTYDYCKDDSELQQAYIQKPFKTTTRDGVSENMQNMSEALCQNLIEPYLKQYLGKEMSFEIIILMLQLVQGISPCLFSMYLRSLFGDCVQFVKCFLNTIEIENYKMQGNRLYYCLLNLTRRFTNQHRIPNKWEWQIKTKLIGLLMKSKILKTQLSGIKMLVELCQKCEQQMGVYQKKRITQFILNNKMVQQIFQHNNHFQIVLKGKEILKYIPILQEEVTVLLNLLDASHQNICKEIYKELFYLTKQHSNIIMNKLVSLQRSQCILTQSIELITKIITEQPDNVQANLQSMYAIIKKHYCKLRKDIRQRIVQLYFELFDMGVQLDESTERDRMLVILQSVVSNIHTPLTLTMLEEFLNIIKRKQSKQIYSAFKNIRNKAIESLFMNQKIHVVGQNIQIRQLQLRLIKQMLFCYDGHQTILTYEELCLLIEQDSSFGRFIQKYPPSQQEMLLQGLIHNQSHKHNSTNLTHTNNIIEAYYKLSSSIQPPVLTKFKQWFMNTHNQIEKNRLGAFIYSQSQEYSLSTILNLISSSRNSQNQIQLWSYIILLRECIRKSDEKGFGGHPPFTYFGRQSSPSLKVVNSFNFQKPQTFTISISSFSTILQVIRRVLQRCKLQIDKVKIKMGAMFLTIDNLKTKIIEAYPDQKEITLMISESTHNEWFDKKELINNREALKEIFTKYGTNNKMYRWDCVRLFRQAQFSITSQNDGRITDLFNKYSTSGQFLILEEWLAFFTKSAQENPLTVANNVKQLGYPHLFSNKNILQQSMEEEHNQTREQLANNRQIYQLLFKQYANKSLQLLCIQLLQLLPVTRQINTQAIQIPLLGDMGEIYNQQLQLWYSLGLIFNQDIQQINAYLTPLTHNLSYLIKHKQIAQRHPQMYINCIYSITHMLRNCTQTRKIPILQSVQHIRPQTIQVCTHIHIPNYDIYYLQYITNLLFSQNNIVKWGISKKHRLIQCMMALCIVNYNNTKPQSQINVVGQLVFHNDDIVSKIVNMGYYIMSEYHIGVNEQYQGMQVGHNCKHYFAVLNQMISFRDKQISQTLSNKIQQQLITTNASQSLIMEQNQELVGKINLLNYIKMYHPFVEFQEAHALMKILNHKCITNTTRNYLYQLSNEVCDISYNISVIKEIVTGINISKTSVPKGNKHMGLFNLSAICYINATIQQLFMIQEFRNGIIEAKVPSNPSQYFQHFQYIIYQLKYGHRQFFVPQQFCNTFTNAIGQPVNIRQQEDAFMFMTSLFDKLQWTLKQTNNADVVGMNFKGTLGNVISCTTCLSESVNQESFYVLILPIKDKKNIFECIDKFIEPDVIQGYNCKNCDNKTTIQKRQRIQSLPRYLFVGLQRITFSVQQFCKIKEEHEIEYPQQIDLSEYLESEMQEQRCTKYVLRGFTVHVGGAQSGHYYSIIKEGNKWVKFDDSRVSQWSWQTNEKDRQGAYLLLYERKQNKIENKNNLSKIEIGNHELMSKVNEDNEMLLKQTLFLQKCFPNYVTSTFQRIKFPFQFVYPDTLSYPYHPSYQTLSEEMSTILIQVHQVALQYVLLTTQTKQLALANFDFSPSIFRKCIYFLLSVYHLCPLICEGVLRSIVQNNKYFRMIYVHSDQTIRQGIQFVFRKLMTVLICLSPFDYLIIAQKDSIPELVCSMLNKLMNGLSEVGKHMNKMTEYFQFMLQLCQNSQSCEIWFERNNLGPKLTHFILQGQSPLKQLDNLPLHNHVNKKLSSFKIVFKLLLKMYINWTQFADKFPFDEKISSLRSRAYGNMELYKKLHEQRYEYIQINQLLCKMCINNKQLTSKVIKYIKESINRFSSNDSYILAYLNLLFCFLSLEDSFNAFRLQGVLGVPAFVKDQDNQYISLQNKKSRVCQYWNNSFKQSDQTIIPFLQFLFRNRCNINYFTLISVSMVLKLMKNCTHVRQYILSVPPPSLQWETYISWFDSFYKIAYNSEDLLPDISRGTIIYEISKMLDQSLQQISQNPKREWYRKLCRVKPQKEGNAQVVKGFSAHFTVIVSEETLEPILVEYTFTFSQQVRRIQLECLQWNHSYSYEFQRGTYSLATPFCQDPQSGLEKLFKIVFQDVREVEVPQKESTMQKEGEEGMQNKNLTTDAAVMANRQNVREERIVQCIFCQNLVTYAAICPVCSNELGEIL